MPSTLLTTGGHTNAWFIVPLRDQRCFSNTAIRFEHINFIKTAKSVFVVTIYLTPESLLLSVNALFVMDK